MVIEPVVSIPALCPDTAHRFPAFQSAVGLLMGAPSSMKLLIVLTT